MKNGYFSAYKLGNNYLLGRCFISNFENRIFIQFRRGRLKMWSNNLISLMVLLVIIRSIESFLTNKDKILQK